MPADGATLPFVARNTRPTAALRAKATPPNPVDGIVAGAGTAVGAGFGGVTPPPLTGGAVVGVLVGFLVGFGVFVGTAGTGVLVGGTGVLVAVAVAVGGTGVSVGVGVFVPPGGGGGGGTLDVAVGVTAFAVTLPPVNWLLTIVPEMQTLTPVWIVTPVKTVFGARPITVPLMVIVPFVVAVDATKLVTTPQMTSVVGVGVSVAVGGVPVTVGVGVDVAGVPVTVGVAVTA
jgi:hypothetical protein